MGDEVAAYETALAGLGGIRRDLEGGKVEADQLAETIRRAWQMLTDGRAALHQAYQMIDGLESSIGGRA
jgi:exonuclease VII small subunit